MYFYQILAKTIAFISRVLFKGSGQTWPGEVILKLDSKILAKFAKYFSQIILVVGTNGKTSTTKFLVDSLRNAKISVITNNSGANLLNGVVSAVLLQLPLKPTLKKYVAVFEVDEYSLLQISTFLKPDFVIMLNLFRDQLDRYGEISNILVRFKQTLSESKQTQIIYLNSDPSLYYLINSLPNNNFGYSIPPIFLNKSKKIMSDFAYCQNCKKKLSYSGFYLGHVGNWQCRACQKPEGKSFVFNKLELLKMVEMPDYLQINLGSVFILLKQLNVSEEIFWQTVQNWQPAYGRGEVFKTAKHDFIFYLGKNPSSWTATMANLKNKDLGESELILGLNNRVPDGADISWIWDAEFNTQKLKRTKISIFGDRAYDLAVRLKIANIKVEQVFLSLDKLKEYLETTTTKRIIFVCNYSALLSIRKLLTGKQIRD